MRQVWSCPKNCIQSSSPSIIVWDLRSLLLVMLLWRGKLCVLMHGSILLISEMLILVFNLLNIFSPFSARQQFFWFIFPIFQVLCKSPNHLFKSLPWNILYVDFDAFPLFLHPLSLFTSNLNFFLKCEISSFRFIVRKVSPAVLIWVVCPFELVQTPPYKVFSTLPINFFSYLWNVLTYLSWRKNTETHI